MDKQLMERFGDRMTDDWWKRITYGRDLAEVPGVFCTVLKLETVPDLVIRPYRQKKSRQYSNMRSQGISR